MGLFDRLKTKEEDIHIDRSESGKASFRYDDLEPGEKPTEKLLDEYYEKHPTRTMKFKQELGSRWNEYKSDMAINRKERRETRHALRDAEREAFQRGLYKGRVSRSEKRGFERGFGVQPQRVTTVYKGKKGKARKTQYMQPVEYVFDPMIGRPMARVRNIHESRGEMVFDMMTGQYVRRKRR